MCICKTCKCAKDGACSYYDFWVKPVIGIVEEAEQQAQFVASDDDSFINDLNKALENITCEYQEDC